MSLLVIFQRCRNLEAGDNQFLKSYWRDWESNPGPLVPQAKCLTTTPPLFPTESDNKLCEHIRNDTQVICFV